MAPPSTDGIEVGDSQAIDSVRSSGHGRVAVPRWRHVPGLGAQRDRVSRRGHLRRLGCHAGTRSRPRRAAPGRPTCRAPGTATSTGSWSATATGRCGASTRGRAGSPTRWAMPSCTTRPGSTGATRSSSSRTGTTWSSTSCTWARSARACTASPGTLEGVRRRLPYLRDLGIGAIQLMPPFEFAGDRSWGYNPAFPYAVESTYGGPG